MIWRFLLLTVVLTAFSACSTFDREAIIGTWQGQTADGTIPQVPEPSKVQFVFNADNTFSMNTEGGKSQSGSYSWLGNSLELKFGEALAITVGVAQLENDILILNFRPMEEKGKLTLARVPAE